MGPTNPAPPSIKLSVYLVLPINPRALKNTQVSHNSLAGTDLRVSLPPGAGAVGQTHLHNSHMLVTPGSGDTGDTFKEATPLTM